jgi:TonB-dependent receptor
LVLALRTMLASASIAAVSVSAAPAAAQAVHVSIPAQDATSALLSLSRQADVQILSARRDTSGKRAHAIRGLMSPDHALAQLLAGTGLRASRINNRTFTVDLAPAKPDPTPKESPANIAEQAAPPPEPEIIVTGFRQSLRKALQAKRGGDRVGEVLAAEDLGKLPEPSIAESLARLPGVTTNRDRGNGTQISIRGMGPDLINTLLNGRELVSAEPARNIRFDQYPAELLTGATVYKSPTASQPEGAIAGQVDLQTARPLDFAANRTTVNLRAVHNDMADSVMNAPSAGYVANISAVRQMADDRLGISLGFSGRRQPVATVRTNIFRYSDVGHDFDGNPLTTEQLPFGFEALERGGTDVRYGGVGAVQWQATHALEFNLDAFYSNVRFEEKQRGFRVEDLQSGSNAYANAILAGNHVIGVQTITTAAGGQTVRDVNEHFFFRDRLWAGGLNAKWRPAGWEVSADLGLSTTGRNQRFVTIRTVPDEQFPTTYFASGNGQPASIRVDTDLADPALNRIAALQIPENGGGAPVIHDRMWTGRADVERDLGIGFLRSLRFGARWTDRSKHYVQRTQLVEIDPALQTPVPADLLDEPYRFSGPFAGLPSFLTIDIDRAVGQLFGAIDPQESFNDQRSSWTVSEKTYAGFWQLDLSGTFAGMPFTGNAGLRVVRTATNSTGTRIEEIQQPDLSVVKSAVPIAVRNSFTDWLPVANLTLKPAASLQLRLAASKGISRAPLDDLNAGEALYVYEAPFAVSGNPRLKPFRSANLDASLEWFLDRDSALTVAAFYKDFDSYIAQQLTPMTIADPNGGAPLQGLHRHPVNARGGTIRGIEITFQKALDFLPRPLNGLGVFVSYSRTRSNIIVHEADNAFGSIPLPGLSKEVANATLYYSKNGFEARIGVRHRSAFATELGDADRLLVNGGETIVDFQTSYRLERLNKLKLLLQVNNVTDAPFETYYGSHALQARYEKFGRRIFFGVGFDL